MAPALHVGAVRLILQYQTSRPRLVQPLVPSAADLSADPAVAALQPTAKKLSAANHMG